MLFEGKLSGQPPRLRFNSGHPKPTCECCISLIDIPIRNGITITGGDGIKKTMLTYNYFGTKMFIYEAKSGFSVVYCSKECRNKHNHRFNKG